MSAPLQNKFWLKRSSHGRKPLFREPEEFYNACLEYFEVTSKQTVYKFDYVGKDGNKVETHTPIPFTISGLCTFLDISQQSWYNYKNNNTKDFFEVCTRVEDIIKTQKFNYAVANIFNHSIIARDLGLVDKQDLTTKGKSIKAEPVKTVLEIRDFTKKPNDNEN